MTPRAALAVARRGFSTWATYGAATVAGLFTNTVFGFLRCAVLLAALRVAGPIEGYDRAAALTYVWLGQGLIMWVHAWNWNELAVRIQSGDIAVDLLRPVDPHAWWLARDHGRALYQLLARGLPPFLIGSLVYDLRVPDDLGHGLAFGLSLWLALLVAFGLRFLVNLAALWVLDWRGLLNLSHVLTNVLSGFLVPVAFFPGWAAALMRALPWYAMVQAPVDVFLQLEPTGAVLARQLLWAVALTALGRGVQRAALTRLVVQGG